MRIVFDQATPLPIRPYLKGHIVRTAAQQGWERMKNGELMAAEPVGFDLLLTTDKNIRSLGQQQLPELAPYVQLVVEAVNAAPPGSYVEVDIPYK